MVSMLVKMRTLERMKLVSISVGTVVDVVNIKEFQALMGDRTPYEQFQAPSYGEHVTTS